MSDADKKSAPENKIEQFYMDETDSFDNGGCLEFEAHLKKPEEWDTNPGRHVISYSAYREAIEALKFYADKKHYYLQAGMGERIADTGQTARALLTKHKAQGVL